MNEKMIPSESGKTLGLVKKEGKQKSNGEQLIEYFEIKNTPFTVAKHEGKYYIMMGKYRLTEPLPNKGHAMYEAKRMSWTRIMQVISVMIEDNNNEIGLKKQMPQIGKSPVKDTLNNPNQVTD